MKTNPMSFRGINISNTQNLKLYKITPKDSFFLEELSSKIDLKKLQPDLDNDGIDVCSYIIKRGLRCAQWNSTESVLLAYKNVPCGILVSTPERKKNVVDYIATWPIKRGEKPSLGGKTMFLQMFEDALIKDAKPVELDAVRYGKAISFYMQLGFGAIGGDFNYETMRIGVEKIKKTIEILKEKISLVKTNNTEDVDLYKELKFPTLE